MIRKAKPSAIADFPTQVHQGEGCSTAQIWQTRSISFSRPTTGSNFPSSAISVKSLPKLSKTGVLDFY
jgi:hypothetical protein